MIPARTSAFYVANLGSEVSRLQSALANGDTTLAEGALQRAKTIFERLSEMPLREAERAEIKILREVIEDLPNKNPHFSVDAASLRDYFLPFAHRLLDMTH
ncbi:MAG: hypothetical protein EXS51_00660 [Candidatus Taylorbacteria bacterium]|nr:hypothetical protein [Candidatus Taylorbacteria bacterium]